VIERSDVTLRARGLPRDGHRGERGAGVGESGDHYAFLRLLPDEEYFTVHLFARVNAAIQ
jgi:hypothetical protein